MTPTEEKNTEKEHILEKVYERALKSARDTKPLPVPCHDCGVMPGKLHEEGCDSPTCTICGIQLLQCGHKEGNSIHSGIECQEIRILCEALSLFTKWVDGRGWVDCARDDKDATYDLNRGIVMYQSGLRAVRKRMELRE